MFFSDRDDKEVNPMEDGRRYIILAALHKVAGPLPIARYFWLLGEVYNKNRQEEGIRILEAIHGLASIQRVDNNNHRYNYKLQRTGGSLSYIQAFCVAAPDRLTEGPNCIAIRASSGYLPNYSALTLMDSKYWIEPHKTHVVYGDNPLENDAHEKWNRAKENLKIINDQKIPYSNLGVGFLSFLNGNTVYGVVADLMGVKPYVFPRYLNPGMGSNRLEKLLPFSNIERILEQNSLKKINRSTFLKEKLIIQVGVSPLSEILPHQSKRSKEGHHFFILSKKSNGREEVIEALHGLPADLIRQESQWCYSPTRNSHHSTLWAFCLNPFKANTTDSPLDLFSYNAWINPKSVHTLYGEKVWEVDVEKKWQRAKDYIQPFNARKLPYSTSGSTSSLFKQGFNGNSFYCAISEIMGFNPPYHFEQYTNTGFNRISLASEDFEFIAAKEERRKEKEMRDAHYNEDILPQTSFSDQAISLDFPPKNYSTRYQHTRLNSAFSASNRADSIESIKHGEYARRGLPPTPPEDNQAIRIESHHPPSWLFEPPQPLNRSRTPNSAYPYHAHETRYPDYFIEEQDPFGISNPQGRSELRQQKSSLF
jgi:hypothetical protein